jgi:hypothetical protein
LQIFYTFDTAPFIKPTCHPDRREGSHLSRFRHYVASRLVEACRIYKDQAATPQEPVFCNVSIFHLWLRTNPDNKDNNDNPDNLWPP